MTSISHNCCDSVVLFNFSSLCPDLSAAMLKFKQKFWLLNNRKRHSTRAIVCLPAQSGFANKRSGTRILQLQQLQAPDKRQLSQKEQLSKARGEPNLLIMRPICRSCVATPMSLQRRNQDRRKSPFPRMRNALHSLGPIVLRKYWNELNEFERKGEFIFQ